MGAHPPGGRHFDHRGPKNPPSQNVSKKLGGLRSPDHPRRVVIFVQTCALAPRHPPQQNLLSKKKPDLNYAKMVKNCCGPSSSWCLVVPEIRHLPRNFGSKKVIPPPGTNGQGLSKPHWCRWRPLMWDSSYKTRNNWSNNYKLSNINHFEMSIKLR